MVTSIITQCPFPSLDIHLLSQGYANEPHATRVSPKGMTHFEL
jgi:hypothetical protein